MKIIDTIKKTKTEKELRTLAKWAIRKANRHSKKQNEPTSFIGTGADINPNNSINTKPFEVYDHYRGYIPLGTKITYGTYFDLTNNTYSNQGFYYYLDDESYIMDFFKFIKNREINNEYDILVAVKDFMTIYFDKYVDAISRDELHQLIYRTDGYFHQPVKEHSIKDFKGNGSALCSEYSAIAENILSVLGFDVMYIIDCDHAYNVLFTQKGGKEKAHILDYSMGVEVFDHDLNYVKMHPYFEEIDEFEDIIDGTGVELNDYFLQIINGNLFRKYTEDIRDYGVIDDVIDDIIEHDNDKDIILTRHK